MPSNLGRWSGAARGRRDPSRSRSTDGAVFSPIANMATQWSYAWWANDPAWTRPADGAAVASWSGAVGGQAAANATGASQPLYRAAPAAMNYQPCIEFDGTDDFLQTASITTGGDPYTVIWIGRFLNAAPAAAMVPVSAWGSTGASCRFINRNASNAYQGKWPTSRTGTLVSADLNPHMARAQIGTTDAARIDETSTALSGDPGAATIAGTVVFGADVSSSTAAAAPFAPVQLAFVGIYPGDITADASWTRFKAWAGATYGLTIA